MESRLLGNLQTLGGRVLVVLVLKLNEGVVVLKKVGGGGEGMEFSG